MDRRHQEKAGRCEHCDCEDIPEESKNESVWVETATLPAFPPLRQDLSADIVVIGAGITGLTAALELAQAGKQVVVLEASKIGRGVTGYTTAHLTSIIDTRYQDLIKKFGEDKARLVAASGEAAIAHVKALVTHHQIKCDFKTTPGYLYSEKEQDVSMLRAEVEAASRLGLSASWAEQVPLPFATVGGAKIEGQAVFHPLQYLQGLVTAFIKAGGKVFEMTRVTEVSDGTPCLVTTERAQVRADAVIMATHTPITRMLGMQSKIEPFRSYVVAATLKDHSIPREIFWDTEQPYHYIRSFETASDSVLIIGGEDHETGIRTDAEEHYRKLISYVKKRFPVASITHRWSAQVFEPIDSLPYIGRCPRSQHVYAATGYAGNGMTFGTVAGMLLPQLILRGEHEWAHLYRPSRFTISAQSMKRQLKISRTVFKHWVLDRIRTPDGTDVGGVARGEGKVLTLDGKKIAVYKDAAGTVMRLSPVCTHAGCIVAWNNAEKTWDCPCHGGRYTPEGKVINGPPIKDLAPIK